METAKKSGLNLLRLSEKALVETTRKLDVHENRKEVVGSPDNVVRGWDRHPTLPARICSDYVWREFETLPGYHCTRVRVMFKLSVQ